MKVSDLFTRLRTVEARGVTMSQSEVPAQDAAAREESQAQVDALIHSLRAHVKTPLQAAKVVDRILREFAQPHHESMSWGDRLLTLDKSAAFRDDEAFRAALREADSSTGQNQYESPDGIVWRYNTLIWAARSCLGLPGDYVECGVYRGDMTWMITQTVDIASSGKTFYLFDTFAGFDTRYSSEADFPGTPHVYALANKEYTAPDIESSVRERFRDQAYVVVVKGTVPDVLRQRAPNRVAFLHLDMNSPRAEVGALDVLFDRVSQGGIVIFDDYGWKLFNRQKAAADAFAAAHGQVILELPTGQGLMFKR